jgi:hypothetical protein
MLIDADKPIHVPIHEVMLGMKDGLSVGMSAKTGSPFVLSGNEALSMLAKAKIQEVAAHICGSAYKLKP